jgi:hypothetical protein
MDMLQKSKNLRNHPIIFLHKKVQLIGLPTFMTSTSITKNTCKLSLEPGFGIYPVW